MDFRTLDRTWIAAEIGVNHEGDEAVAIDLINKAAYAGADAVKFQTFEIEHYISTEQPERYQRTKGFQLSRDAFRRLKAAADAAGVLFFSTPLSFHDVAFLDEIAPIFKVSSGDLTFLNLIETIAATNKPMIVSTGLGSHDEIAAAVDRILSVRPSARDDGSLMLMHCVSVYPTDANNANLRNIQWLKDAFGVPVGYSDHTLGTKACELAVAAGAVALEKHFTYRKEDQAFHDHYLSADPDDLVALVAMVRQAERHLGNYERRPLEAEIDNADHMRRSIGTIRDVAQGEVLSADDLTWLRPAWGVGPDAMNAIVGRSVARAIPAGHLVREEDLC